jgi:uncharacterized protein (DUF2147 family)
MLKKLIASTTLAMLCIGSAAQAQSPAVDGVWKSEDGEGMIEVAPCAADPAARCGKIVWIKTPLTSEGKPLTDLNNPDAKLQKRPMCGVEILTGMKPSADGSFAGGTIYDPEEGKMYKGSFKLDGAALKVTGFVEAPVLGKLSETDTWTRVTTPFDRCK